MALFVCFVLFCLFVCSFVCFNQPPMFYGCSTAGMRYFEVELYGVSKGDAVIGTPGCGNYTVPLEIASAMQWQWKIAEHFIVD